MLALVNHFAQDESGATMVEYGLLVIFIALVVAAGAQTLGTNLSALFSNVGAALDTAVPTP